MSLTTFEKVELALIIAAIPAVWLLTTGLQSSLSLGTFVCYSAALFLGQGLIRDLIRLAAERKKEKGSPLQLKCLCAESTIGILAVVVGVLLLLGGIEQAIALTQTSLTGVVTGILVSGFVMKNYVVTIRRIEDHHNVILG